MKASDFLKQFEARKRREAEEQEGKEREHTLQENAKSAPKIPPHLTSARPLTGRILSAIRMNWSGWNGKVRDGARMMKGRLSSSKVLAPKFGSAI